MFVGCCYADLLALIECCEAGSYHYRVRPTKWIVLQQFLVERFIQDWDCESGTYRERERAWAPRRSAQSDSSLRLRMPIRAPRTKQEQVFKQELILDTRAGPEWQLWQILLFKLALNQSNFHIVFGRHKPGLLGFYWSYLKYSLLLFWGLSQFFLLTPIVEYDYEYEYEYE